MRLRKLNPSLVYLIIEGASGLFRSMVYIIATIYYVQSAGLNPLQLVLVGTFLEITCFLCEVPTGVVADTFSRRLSVIIGLMVIGAGFMLKSSLPFFLAIVLAEMIRGVGETFISGALQAWLADEIGEDRVGPVYLRASQIGTACGIAGTVTGVALGTVALWIPIFTGGLLMFGLGLFLVLTMPEQGFQPIPTEERNPFKLMAGTFKEGVRSVRGRPLLTLLLGIGFFAGATSEGFDRLWEAHLLTNFNFPVIGELKPVVWFGIISVGTSLVCIAATELFRRRLNRVMENATATARLLLILNLLLIVTTIVFGLAGDFSLAVGALVFKAVLSTLGGPLYNSWLIQNIDPKVRATVLSMSSQIDALGQFVGGPFMGLLANAVSIRAAMVVTALVRFPNLLLYGRTLRHRADEPVDLAEPGAEAVLEK